MKIRLDQLLVSRRLVSSRSQAENYIRLGKVLVREKTPNRHPERSETKPKDLDEIPREARNDNGETFAKKAWRKITKSGVFVDEDSEIKVDLDEQFVSRAALKLKSVAEKLELDFRERVVLDIGSSTGGFTEFALSRGAKKVIAVDVGTNQLHPKLRTGEFAKKIELYEKTDIRDVCNCHPERSETKPKDLSEIPREARNDKNFISRMDSPDKPANDKTVISEIPDIILADVSFISLREILPHVAKNLADSRTEIVAMLKPQFETGARVKNAGVVKNERERRDILKQFELWSRKYFVILAKKDSEIAGATGNRERFYLLKLLARH